ncbi:MAG: NADH-quinone oxidoreductase subunit L, partial [Actinomycetota bacterium]
DMLSKSAEERSHVVDLFSWIPVGSLEVKMAFLADPLSITMALFVTGIGTLIHLYAVGYMHGDPKFSKFFIYLNLFAFSMLMLVLGENLLVTFLGWEGVGTCSYFLISFWHTRESAATAGKKAFVTNRVGDWGVMTAMFLAFASVGTLSYKGINDAAIGGSLSHVTATAIALMLFIGACGKSAQLPLYIWLPDAIEGPTPVSALIHAATMVTAGVYLIARMNPLFHAAPYALETIVVIGVLGLLMAGAIALVQTDIKRIIAFSTMSQIAYMFVGVGLGAYWAGIFHLFTHAFFKALLFMGAGLVIHALHGEQDVRNMGGLRSVMPKTYFCMLIGALALVGIFPLSGGFSKDAILASALEVGTPLAWVAYIGGLAGALLTGIYTFRLMFLVFHRRMSPYAEAVAPKAVKHHGEGPSSMLWPVYILTLGAAIVGFLQVPGLTHVFFDWLEPIAPAGMVEPSAAQEWLTTLVAVSIGVAGIAIAGHLYLRESDATERMRLGHGRLVDHALEHRLYWDDLYAVAFERPAQWLAAFLRRDVDRPVAGWLPTDGLGTLTAFLGRSISVIENGVVRSYALVIALGVAGLLLGLLVRAG